MSFDVKPFSEDLWFISTNNINSKVGFIRTAEGCPQLLMSFDVKPFSEDLCFTSTDNTLSKVRFIRITEGCAHGL